MEVKFIMTRRQLSKLYDSNYTEFSKIAALNEAEITAIDLDMRAWSYKHCDKYNFCKYTTEQYNKALKHFILDRVCFKLNYFKNLEVK